jgi:hypothetical protein
VRIYKAVWCGIMPSEAGFQHPVSPDIARVEVAAAAKRRAMKLYYGTADGPQRSGCGQIGSLSISLRMFHAEVLVTNRTVWKSRTREFNPSVSFIKISILKNFHEMFGLEDVSEVKRI